jgi:acyl carrier protein
VKNPEIRQIAIDILAGIAPEADFSLLDDGDELREVLDLDSMDFLNFIAGLHKATGAEIPETDYQKLFTLAGVIAYLGKSAC